MCLEPLYVKVKLKEEDGEFKKKLTFVNMFDDYDMTLPCGKCIECLLERSNEWAYRICLESKSHDDSCMITLTYAPEFCDGNLHKEHYQKWLKRIRKKYGDLRYFICGEYGSQKSRPHYHCILFGKDFDDKVVHHYDNGHPVYVSQELQDTWPYGFASIVDINYFSARYCAKYMQKLQDAPKDCIDPFISMSLKPGLGYQYFVDNIDSVLESDKVYFNGYYYKTPRYFLKLAARLGRADALIPIRENREKKKKLIYDDYESLQERKKKYEKLLT